MGRNVTCRSFRIDRLPHGIVISSEARNLLLFAEKQQIPHGLKAVRDDNLESPAIPPPHTPT
jgi:hypothetical protein